MAEDWATDVKKFAPSADDTVIAGIVRYCGIALQSRDSSLVSFADPAETGRVRDNFLKKKLGLTQADEALDQAIAAVGERMKGVNFKNRVTVYYLLLEHFDLLHLFGKVGAGAAAGLKAYLASHSSSTLAVSGFNDKTGDVAANAALSKNRAQAVRAALVSAGIPEASIELVKPAETTDTSGANAAARRVEVVVR